MIQRRTTRRVRLGRLGLMEPTCREGCGGGGNDRAPILCADPGDAGDFGTGRITNIVPSALLFGGGAVAIKDAGGFTTGVGYGYQAGGISQSFSMAPSDVFTEGEGVAGHPAKWGYRRTGLPVCKASGSPARTPLPAAAPKSAPAIALPTWTPLAIGAAIALLLITER